MLTHMEAQISHGGSMRRRVTEGVTIVPTAVVPGFVEQARWAAEYLVLTQSEHIRYLACSLFSVRDSKFCEKGQL